MPDEIESRSFREAARKNCISYLGLPIYVTNIPVLVKMALPSFKAQSPNGAISQLFSTLVNASTQIGMIRKSLRMTESKPVPGVSYDEMEGMAMTLDGTVYFANASQYDDFVTTLKTIGETYGWREIQSKQFGTAVYHPIKNDFSNSDPTHAAIKGMVLGTVSDMMDTQTLLNASDEIKEGEGGTLSDAEKVYFMARDRYLGGSIFNIAAIQYYTNTVTTVQNKWTSLSKEVPTILIDGIPHDKANIAYMPTALSVTPGAYVHDETGYYPTRCAVVISMTNPYGSLFANATITDDPSKDVKEQDGMLATEPDNYVKSYKARHNIK